MGKLTNVAIKNAKPGRYQDGQGLMIQRTTDGGKWMFRYSISGRRRDMGLGNWPSVSLAEARRERDKWAAVIRSGRDPISEREAQRVEAKAALDRVDPTFEEMAQVAFEARKAKLRGDGERGRWFSPLRLHIVPKIGKRRMSQIVPADIRDALSPIWKTKHPTAEKAIQRTRMVFQTAMLSGIDCTPLTVERAEHMLGEVIHKVQHLDALPWQAVPALYTKIPDTVPGQCLRWSILTLVRPDAARGTEAKEIDGDVWTVPADRVKGMEGRVQDFRVPLSREALRVAERAAEFSDGYLFPGRTRGHVSDVAVTKTLRALHETATVHGFRSTFRSWVQDTDACAWDVAETALGHKIGGKVERSYARSDLLDRRRVAMEAWAAYVTGAAANVVRLKR